MLPAKEHLRLEPFRQRVYNTRADAMQSAGKRIIGIVEFSSRMQLSKNNLHSGYLELRMNAYRNAAAVVLYAYAPVVVQRYRYFIRIFVRRLVYSVVYYFPEHMVQSARACRAYVHARAFAHCVQSFQNLYI